jgi:hypothetical protein
MKAFIALFSLILSCTLVADEYLVSIGYSRLFSQPRYEATLDIDYNDLITFGDELTIDIASIYQPSKDISFTFEFGPRFKSMSAKTLDIGIYGRACLVTFFNMNFFIGGSFSWGNDWGAKDSVIITSLNGETFTVYREGSSTYHEGGLELGFNFPVFTDNIEFEVRGNFMSRVFYHELSSKKLSSNFLNIFEQLDARYHNTIYNYETMTIGFRYIF